MSVENMVRALPMRLRNFFARYPPQFYSAAAIPKPTPPSSEEPAASSSLDSSLAPGSPSTASVSDLISSIPPLPSPYTPSRSARNYAKPDPTAWSPSRSLLRSLPGYPNPFLPFKSPETGRTSGARVSLRRQAELVKLAKKHGVEELLPPGKKATEYKAIRLAEVGLRVRGTGIGQKVKGHQWERAMAWKLEQRRKAMLKMPAMIREWKQRGHGRGWKKYPKK